MSWYQDYQGKLIGFVVKTRKDKFVPIIGRPYESDGDDDCFINVVGKQSPVETLEEALFLLDQEKHRLHRTFRVPTKSCGMMGHWLVPLVIAEDGADPRK